MVIRYKEVFPCLFGFKEFSVMFVFELSYSIVLRIVSLIYLKMQFYCSDAVKIFTSESY